MGKELLQALITYWENTREQMSPEAVNDPENLVTTLEDAMNGRR